MAGKNQENRICPLGNISLKSFMLGLGSTFIFSNSSESFTNKRLALSSARRELKHEITSES
jgi:hypothetical protein